MQTFSCLVLSLATWQLAMPAVAQMASRGNQARDSNGLTSLHKSGTNIVDQSGNNVQLRGTNIGGWLVTEGWMNGFSDSSDIDPFRFSLETLERRFGARQAKELIDVWQDNFITAADLDIIKGLGMNTIRVPFGYRNLQDVDGNWIRNSAGEIDFARLDWIVTQAGQRGLYTILVFHVWEGQQADYSQISKDTKAGDTLRSKAEGIWTEVAKHFKGDVNIAAFDAINEPTGSPDNILQKGLYKAVRDQDPDRMIVMESVSADPGQAGWENVVYSFHPYNMMGDDLFANQAAFNRHQDSDISRNAGFGIPTYIGEFKTRETGPTTDWLLDQFNTKGLHWTSWTYKTVDMGGWGLCNLPGTVRVDLMRDSFDSIKSTWNGIGACAQEKGLVAAFKKALAA